ncbi:hypothetical protein [Nocardia otitidiscaviarum]|uniref:hypothetical protein n=1 Tax=Nocardia otitidiscaviarum TaxID=1823 RepID=UPI002454E8BC|nr:hypothetical protein [Nocardia otitidiscaviarum]
MRNKIIVAVAVAVALPVIIAFAVVAVRLLSNAGGAECQPNDANGALALGEAPLPDRASVEAYTIRCDRFYDFDARIDLNGASVNDLISAMNFTGKFTTIGNLDNQECYASDRVRSAINAAWDIVRELRYEDCSTAPTTVNLRVSTEYPTPGV